VTATNWSLPARLLGAFLLAAMVVGAFVLWVGVPTVILWGLGQMTSDPTEHLVLGLIAVPMGMMLFGLLLALLNTAFLRISGVALHHSEDDDDWRPRLRGPLDRIIGISAVVCLAAFLIWLIFGSAGVGPAGPW
jgi:hypothetical protein